MTDTQKVYLDVIPDGEVCVLRGEHRPPGEGLHHRRALLVEGEPDLSSHEGGLVWNIEHRVVNLISTYRLLRQANNV